MEHKQDIASLLHQIANKANNINWQWFWVRRIDGDLYSIGVDLNRVEAIANELLSDVRQWAEQLQDNYPDLSDIPTTIARLQAELNRILPEPARLSRVEALCTSTDAALSDEQQERACNIGRITDDIAAAVEVVIEELRNTKQYDLLPTIYNTERERTAFQNAINAGYMVQEGSRYNWIKSQTQLAYFLRQIYCPSNTTDEPLPESKIVGLFGAKGSHIQQSNRQADNHKYGHPQKWRPIIESLVPSRDNTIDKQQ